MMIAGETTHHVPEDAELGRTPCDPVPAPQTGGEAR